MTREERIACGADPLIENLIDNLKAGTAEYTAAEWLEGKSDQEARLKIEFEIRAWKKGTATRSSLAFASALEKALNERTRAARASTERGDS